jgi:hypothetical protein
MATLLVRNVILIQIFFDTRPWLWQKDRFNGETVEACDALATFLNKVSQKSQKMSENVKKSENVKHSRVQLGTNPAIVRYNASAVKMYSATSIEAHTIENKNI